MVNALSLCWVSPIIVQGFILLVSVVRCDGLDFVRFQRDVLSINLEKKGLKCSKYILQVLTVDHDHHEPSL